MIAAFNQFDGINAVLYYSGDIFKMAGATGTGALMQSVTIGVVNLVMTVVAMFLIDRLGRKPLLLAGSVTFIASHVLAAWAFKIHLTGWPVLVAMMGVVGSHAYSQGAVVWVVINEVLPNAVRACGSAASSRVSQAHEPHAGQPRQARPPRPAGILRRRSGSMFDVAGLGEAGVCSG